MTASSPYKPAGVLLYDGTCGFCSWWVPYWQSTLARAGFEIAPLQSPQFARDVDLDAPESWDLTLYSVRTRSSPPSVMVVWVKCSAHAT